MFMPGLTDKSVCHFIMTVDTDGHGVREFVNHTDGPAGIQTCLSIQTTWKGK
jgi:hypothetical protein